MERCIKKEKKIFKELLVEHFDNIKLKMENNNLTHSDILKRFKNIKGGSVSYYGNVKYNNYREVGVEGSKILGLFREIYKNRIDEENSKNYLGFKMDLVIKEEVFMLFENWFNKRKNSKTFSYTNHFLYLKKQLEFNIPITIIYDDYDMKILTISNKKLNLENYSFFTKMLSNLKTFDVDSGKETKWKVFDKNGVNKKMVDEFFDKRNKLMDNLDLWYRIISGWYYNLLDFNYLRENDYDSYLKEMMKRVFKVKDGKLFREMKNISKMRYSGYLNDEDSIKLQLFVNQNYKNDDEGLIDYLYPPYDGEFNFY